MNRFYTKQTKIYGNFRIWFFLKDPKKLFVAQKINLEDTLIFEGEYSLQFPKSIIWQMDMKLKHKEQEIRN